MQPSPPLWPTCQLPLGGSAPVLRASEISKVVGTGDGRRTILFPTSFQIGAGEFVSIVGPSGSGKSTLLNIIGCLDAASSGRVEVAGEDTGSMSGRQLALVRNDAIGFVFQTPHLLPRSSAIENVALPLVYAGYGRDKRVARARACLERVGLRDRADHRPDQLSGGQQQRVAIARALVAEPKIILADEPTGALDSVAAGNVLGILRELVRDGIALAMVTHDDAIARTAQRTLQVHDGHVREQSAGSC